MALVFLAVPAVASTVKTIPRVSLFWPAVAVHACLQHSVLFKAVEVLLYFNVSLIESQVLLSCQGPKRHVQVALLESWTCLGEQDVGSFLEVISSYLLYAWKVI